MHKTCKNTNRQTHALTRAHMRTHARSCVNTCTDSRTLIQRVKLTNLMHTLTQACTNPYTSAASALAFTYVYTRLKIVTCTFLHTRKWIYTLVSTYVRTTMYIVRSLHTNTYVHTLYVHTTRRCAIGTCLMNKLCEHATRTYHDNMPQNYARYIKTLHPFHACKRKFICTQVSVRKKYRCT